MCKIIYCLILGILTLFALEETTEGVPIGDKSWSIWWQGNIFKPTTNYMPNPIDFPNAILLDIISDRTPLIWYPGAGFWENSIFIARTWLYVQAPLSIPIRIAGDDGHSLYINDNFIIGLPHSDIGGLPFETTGSLALHTGWNKVEAVLYNGPINAGLILQGNGYPLFNSVVDDMNSKPVFIVDNLGDSDNGNQYTIGDNTNTLRKCIRLANITPGADIIIFGVSGVIYTRSLLPELTDDGTLMDASSRWVGAWPSGQPGVILDGSSAGGVDGLRVAGADRCQIRGLFITGFKGNGVIICKGSQFNIIGGTGPGYRNVISSNNRGVMIIDNDTLQNAVIGNYIGTDVTGVADLGNSNNGVSIGNGAQSNTIGGTTSGERNIISGNSIADVDINGLGTNNNRVSGNYIGTSINGNVSLGDTLVSGINISEGAESNIIGGTITGERNIISVCHGAGILISGSSNNKVLGNHIGTDVTGTIGLYEQFDGIWLVGGGSNVIGGSTPGERNIISGNEMSGIHITGSNSNKIIGNYIGTNADGTLTLVNLLSGIWDCMGQFNIIGGENPGNGNVISGNGGDGIVITEIDYGHLGSSEYNAANTANSGTTYNDSILGNYIGTDANGIVALGNSGNGISIGVYQLNYVFENTIAFNGKCGIMVYGTNTDYNTISRNSIHDNANLGISLSNGGNDEISAPILTSSYLSGYTLIISGNSAEANSVVEIFKADSVSSGEGMKYLGNLSASGTGSFADYINVAGKGLSVGDSLVATTTHTDHNTSEFADVVIVVKATPGQHNLINEGWNLISFPVNKCFYTGIPPADQPGCVQLVNVNNLGFSSLADWFSSVINPQDAWQMVIGANGAMDNALPVIFHTLKYMSPIYGYWVKIKEGTGVAVLSFPGSLFNSYCSILLQDGWNLAGCPLGVGYYDTETPPSGKHVPEGTTWVKVAPPVAAYVFSSIAGKYDMIIGEDGAYDPSLPSAFSSLNYVGPGYGYWVKMKQAANLIYSPGAP